MKYASRLSLIRRHTINNIDNADSKDINSYSSPSNTLVWMRLRKSEDGWCMSLRLSFVSLCVMRGNYRQRICQTQQSAGSSVNAFVRVGNVFCASFADGLSCLLDNRLQGHGYSQLESLNNFIWGSIQLTWILWFVLNDDWWGSYLHWTFTPRLLFKSIFCFPRICLSFNPFLCFSVHSNTSERNKIP